MEFSWLSFGIGAGWVALMALFSLYEGTFFRTQRRHAHLCFWRHCGLWAAPLLISVAAGFAMPHILLRWSTYPGDCMHFATISLVVAIAITHNCARGWWPKSERESCPAQVFHKGSGGRDSKWYRDLMIVGVLFGIFMVAAIVMAGLCLRTSFPQQVLIAIWLSLVTVPWLGIGQPNYIVNKGLSDEKARKSRRKAQFQSWFFTLFLTIVILAKMYLLPAIG